MVMSGCAAEAVASPGSSGGESAGDSSGDESLSYDGATRDDDCTEWDERGECVGWEDDG